MARKRATSARTPPEPSKRGRPRCNAHNTYATATEELDIEEDATEDQPVATEKKRVSEPTLEQVLQ